MKTLMKLFSVLFFIAMGYSIYQLLMVSKEFYSVLGIVALGSSSLTSSYGGDSITNVASDARIFTFIFSNIISFIILAISASMLSKDDTNKFLRIIPFVVIVGITLSMGLNFFNINVTDGAGKVLNSTVSILKTAEIFFLPIVCLGNLNPNNTIAGIVKKIGYIVLVLSFGLLIYLWIKKNAFEVLPDPYAENALASLVGFGSSVKFFTISILLEFACLILCYTTNYAFEITTINADNVNYEELKKQAEYNAQNKIDSIYNKEKIEKIDRSVSLKTGHMNINNQLGQNSNVGQVSDEMKNKTGLVETSFIMSKGPVINQNLVQNTHAENDNSSQNIENNKFGINTEQVNNNVNTENMQVSNPSLAGFQNNINNQNNN